MKKVSWTSVREQRGLRWLELMALTERMQQSQFLCNILGGLLMFKELRGGYAAAVLHGLNRKKAIDGMYTSITCLEFAPRTYSPTTEHF